MLRDKLNAFLNDEEANGFLLSGPWGVGKTHFIQEWIKKNETKNRKFIHLSLFGVSNVSELNAQAIEKTNIVAKVGKMLRESNQGITFGVNGMSVSFPIIGLFASLCRMNFRKNSKMKYFLILDDIERKDNKLSLEEIFGFVDQLPKENVKAILITNDELLKEQNFINFKDKVIQYSHAFAEPTEEALKVLLNEELREIIRPISSYANNLRIIIRWAKLLKQIKKPLDKNVARIMFLAMLKLDCGKFSLNDLKNKLRKDQKKLHHLILNDNFTASQIEDNVVKKLDNYYKEDETLFYPCLKEFYIIQDIDVSKNIREVKYIYECVKNEKFNELSDVVLDYEEKAIEPKDEWFKIFFSENPRGEFKSKISSLKTKIGNKDFNQFCVFKLLIRYIYYFKTFFENSNFEDGDFDVINSLIDDVAEYIYNNPYEIEFDNPNKIIVSRENIPDVINNFYCKIHDKVREIIKEKIMIYVNEGGTDFECINKITRNLDKIRENIYRFEQDFIDSFLVKIIENIYQLLGGNVEKLWDEFITSFKCINKYFDEGDYKQTIQFIKEKSDLEVLNTIRLRILINEFCPNLKEKI